ncbi:hypothetical protein PVA44_03375 [Entomospira nematocerorum]|uniref:Uncharacterized protein n=1 Tax=Entomospira nematocerorum TaxID=2719987 RepID=A0A968GBP9_9SPIO|nr:hypothetical protein [Entomospira nematocera]NIZ46927.1 hypothetical protein [Entomospira nematocera]WDI33276.1 hypothetical protein PVA44_03375 [Entomospira nematocera]
MIHKAIWFSLLFHLLLPTTLVATSLDISLNAYLHGLRRHRITAFPTQGQFLQVNNHSHPFRRYSGGITLLIYGDVISQEVNQIRIYIVNPVNRLQSERWLTTIISSLAILSTEETDIQRILAVQRTLERGVFIDKNLHLTLGIDAYGQYFQIESSTS